MMALPITESSNFKILLLWTYISTDILHMEQNNLLVYVVEGRLKWTYRESATEEFHVLVVSRGVVSK